MGRGKKRVGKEINLILSLSPFCHCPSGRGDCGKVKMTHLPACSLWEKLEAPGEPSVRI